MRERVKWVDTAKFLGIFAIYLGHFFEDAGKAYMFVYQFHVPLFFFLSGCMEYYRKPDISFKDFFVRKSKSLLIPFYVFALLSVCVYVILLDLPLSSIGSQLILIMKGCVRNTFIVHGLWFLSCLFVMEIVFFFIRRVRSKLIILSLCVAIYAVYVFLVFPRFAGVPSIPYNVDSMCNYIIYYGLGYLLYPYILRLFALKDKCDRLVFAFIGVICCAYAALVYFGKDIISTPFNSASLAVRYLFAVVSDLLLIMAVLVSAKLLEGIAAFRKTGCETLYLCGNEFIVRTLLINAAGIFGISIVHINPLQTWILVAILLYVSTKWLIPAEKRLAQAAARAWRG